MAPERSRDVVRPGSGRGLSGRGRDRRRCGGGGRRRAAAQGDPSGDRLAGRFAACCDDGHTPALVEHSVAPRGAADAPHRDRSSGRARAGDAGPVGGPDRSSVARLVPVALARKLAARPGYRPALGGKSTPQPAPTGAVGTTTTEIGQIAPAIATRRGICRCGATMLRWKAHSAPSAARAGVLDEHPLRRSGRSSSKRSLALLL